MFVASVNCRSTFNSKSFRDDLTVVEVLVVEDVVFREGKLQLETFSSVEERPLLRVGKVSYNMNDCRVKVWVDVHAKWNAKQ